MLWPNCPAASILTPDERQNRRCAICAVIHNLRRELMQLNAVSFDSQYFYFVECKRDTRDIKMHRNTLNIEAATSLKRRNPADYRASCPRTQGTLVLSHIWFKLVDLGFKNNNRVTVWHHKECVIKRGQQFCKISYRKCVYAKENFSFLVFLSKAVPSFTPGA